MEQNQELELARQFIENTDTSLFLTGKAGTGKTTFLRWLKENSPKRMVVLAPTGIAAINAGGVTIHSFFQLPFSPFVPASSFKGDKGTEYKFQYSKERINIIRSLDLLVIDEISMVRADLLDAIDNALRRYRDRNRPFGGVQMLMIGDLQQLPPVVKDDEWELLRPYYDTMYFFSSHALKQTEYYIIELKEVYRQNDRRFLDILNSIRENRCDANTLAELNKRYIPDFKPEEKEGYIRLTTHNNMAQQINSDELDKLTDRAYSFQASVSGKFPQYAYPADETLTVKKGAQIMFLKNGNADGIHYYNGMLGKVLDVSRDRIIVCGDNEELPFELRREEWTNARYTLNNDSKEIVEEIEGTFTQYPIRLAWAITIHKSQGLTFEHAIIDAAASFTHGQAYVALSRCKSLEGMVLSTPLSERAIINDLTIDNYIRYARHNTPDTNILHNLKKRYYTRLLTDLFDFTSIEQNLQRTVRILDEYLYEMFPTLLGKYKECRKEMDEKVTDVAKRFNGQYTRLMATTENYENDSTLAERIRRGAEYFSQQLNPVIQLIEGTEIEIDNKDIRKRFHDAVNELYYNTELKKELLEYVAAEGLSMNEYINHKSVLSISIRETGIRKKTSSKTEKPEKDRTDLSDIRHPELYRALIQWRNEEAANRKLPVYTVIHQRAIIGIANKLPSTIQELLSVPHFGKKSAEKYGQAILDIVEEYYTGQREKKRNKLF